MVSIIAARRVFSEADQQDFAAWSGDSNPIHIDPSTARRVGPGALVVHGVHELLWCLEQVLAFMPNIRPVASLRVNFDSFLCVGETADAILEQANATGLRAEVRVAGALVLTAVLGFGTPRPAVAIDPALPCFDPVLPLDRPEEQVAGLTGRVPFGHGTTTLTDAFPRVARALGQQRMFALGCFSRLAGMVCPGLHSLFNRLALDAGDEDAATEIGFRIKQVQPAYRRIVQEVWGAGWHGVMTCTVRKPPTRQASIDELARAVVPGEFTGTVALVVGGSRGLGEVAAKLLAAGGASVALTYAAGAEDAIRVGAEIRGFGGTCVMRRLDVMGDVAGQLAGIKPVSNMLAYFATPMIAARPARGYDPARFATLARFYLTGFHDTCQALMAAGATRLAAYYPSSEFVAERPRGMLEYAMAKAAGEVLCQDMAASWKGFHAVVARLPPLATDQNPGLIGSGEVPNTAAMLLPGLRATARHA